MWRAAQQLGLRFIRQDAAVGTIELALVLPILLVLVFGMIEITRFVQINQKLAAASATLADIITQRVAISGAEVTTLLSNADELISPYPRGDLTSVATLLYKDPGRPQHAVWQRSSGRTGTSRVASGDCTSATLPGYTLVDRDQIVVVEIFYSYRSLLGLEFTDPFIRDVNSLYKFTFTRPRYGALMTGVTCPPPFS